MPRDELLTALAHEIHTLERDHPVRVAIDGVDGAGKTTLADELVAPLEARGRTVIRASIDDFHNPQSVRYRQGRYSPEGFFEDSYDLDAVRSQLLDPLGPDGTGTYNAAIFDWRTDDRVSGRLQQAPRDAILLFDGIFLHRAELTHYWEYGIFLDVSFCNSLDRNIRRAKSLDQGTDVRSLLEHFNLRYMPGQRLYLAACNPTARASVVVDYNDLEQPRIVRRRG